MTSYPISTADAQDEIDDQFGRDGVDDNATHPVELLRDGRGIYGIGIPEGFETIEDAALRCGVDDPWHYSHPSPSALILRPDWFPDTKPGLGYAVLQKIAGGFPGGPFRHAHEEELRWFIHQEALKRAGLWEPRSPDLEWWADKNDKKRQARNRAIYHGLRHQSLRTINWLIGKALEEAADMDAVRAARRFTFRYREDIYRACALSRRAMQLCETFPVLAVAVYGSNLYHPKDVSERKSNAAHLVDRGGRLRDVAAMLNVPMELRRIRPGVAHTMVRDLYEHPELLRLIPDTTARQRIWLRVVDWAIGRVDAEFGAWAARHVPEIPGRTDREVGSFVSDIADWVLAGCLPKAMAREVPGRKFITRPFVPSMSLKTITRLSAEWHDAVANNLDGPNSAFPNPWFPAAKIGNTEIVPITDAAALYREGAAMHHCVGTYAGQVTAGHYCVYSVKRDGERVATMALGRCYGMGGKVSIEQIRGPCNAEPPPAILTAVRRWLRAQPPLPSQGTP